MYLNGNTIRIILADDHEIFREGFRSLIEKEVTIELVAEATNGRQLLELARHFNPDIILTDIRMPVMDGIAATALLSKILPHIPVIAISTFDDIYLVMDVLNAGASGYLLKDVSRQELVEAINTVNNNGVYYCSVIRHKLDLAGKNRNNLLTRREKEVLLLICHEKSTREIAVILHISESTVCFIGKVHNIFYIKYPAG